MHQRMYIQCAVLSVPQHLSTLCVWGCVCVCVCVHVCVCVSVCVYACIDPHVYIPVMVCRMLSRMKIQMTVFGEKTLCIIYDESSLCDAGIYFGIMALKWNLMTVMKQHLYKL